MVKACVRMRSPAAWEIVEYAMHFTVQDMYSTHALIAI